MRLSPPSASRCFATFVMAAALLVVPGSIANAAPILLSFDVAMMQPGESVVVDAGLAVGAGAEVNNVNGTNYGALLFDDEFIDVTSDASATSLLYQIQGGLNPHPVDAAYSTSWPFGSAILFYNFVLDQPGTLASVGVSVNNVIGAAGGPLVYPDFLFTPFSLQLNFGQFGILEQAGQLPLGQMTFELNFIADQRPVPDAASTLMLFGIGMTALAARGRLARRRQ